MQVFNKSEFHGLRPNKEFDEFSCDKNEAELTELKKKLVQKKTLADRITNLDLADYLIMGNGDIQKNINQEMSVKEDLFEAIIGAVALDSDWNMESLQDVIEIMLNPDSYFDEDSEANYAGLIQEWTLKRYGTIPQYYFENYFPTGLTTLAHVMSSKNDKLETKFTCQLKLDELNKVFKGFGASKSEARKAVCELAYKELEREDLLFSIRDEIPNPNINDAISQLEILARRGYFSIPFYDFAQKYDNNDNPVWQCTCHIKEIAKHFFAEASSKKYAKKHAAYQMLKYTLSS